MNLSDQVCSLELAKRLKELGIKQESLFWYRKWIPSKGSTYYPPEWTLSLYKGSFDDCELISAFTVGELGMLLPSSIKVEDKNYYIAMDCDKCPYYVSMSRGTEIYALSSDDNDTEANARAKMLIFLLENELIK